MSLKAEDLNVKIFADGADKARILEFYKNPLVKGFTTNPTLMRQVGVTDYEAFAKEILAEVPDRPISFEVFSDDFAEMERQALKIAAWGTSVFVKIPVSNTKGESAAPLIRRLVQQGVQMNITAIFTREQTDEVVAALAGTKHSYVSIFAGRLADTGRDPLPLMKHAVAACNQAGGMEVIWASTREAFNIVQAHEIGCHVITAPADLIKKAASFGRDPAAVSLDAVKVFYDDGVTAGFKL